MIKFLMGLFFGEDNREYPQMHMMGSERNSHLFDSNFTSESDYLKNKRKECIEKYKGKFLIDSKVEKLCIRQQ